MEYFLKCSECSANYSSSYDAQICKKCNGMLEVNYIGTEKVKFGNGFWDYEALLPKSKYRHFVLGGTKIIKSEDCENLYLKLEMRNPTGSFKDRGSVIEVSKALEYGHNEIVCASTGNMAYSLSYYAEIVGLKAKVFVIHDVNKDKLYNIVKDKASVTRISGDFTAAQHAALKYSLNKKNAFLAGDYCYRKEGQKTIAYEIIAKHKDINYIIVPVGNGTLLSGMLKALKQLKDCRMIRKVPKIIAVQSASCNPLVKAFENKSSVKYQRPRTIADGIAVGMPTYGNSAIAELRKNGGTAISISDSELLREQKKFTQTYGIVAETSGVSAIVAYKKLRISKDKKCVAIITGGNV